jgi:hypothetical protein
VAKEITSLKRKHPQWQRRYLLWRGDGYTGNKDIFRWKGDGHTGKGDIFFEEEMATLAKEISSLKRRWLHWQRRYLLWRGDIHSCKGDIFFAEEMATLAKEKIFKEDMSFAYPLPLGSISSLDWAYDHFSSKRICPEHILFKEDMSTVYSLPPGSIPLWLSISSSMRICSLHILCHWGA